MSRRHLSQRRKYGTRQERKVLYIYSEGTVTEFNYFTSIKRELRLTQVNIVPIGTGRNTLSLITYIISNCDLKSGNTECWAVFDKDDFKDFDEAIRVGEANGIKVAYSNEAFELWFILHFQYLNSALGRARLLPYLSKEIGKSYSKDMDIYPILKKHEGLAVKNAERLEKYYDSHGITSFEKRVPSTTVFKLIKRLREL